MIVSTLKFFDEVEGTGWILRVYGVNKLKSVVRMSEEESPAKVGSV